MCIKRYANLPPMLIIKTTKVQKFSPPEEIEVS